MNESELKVQSEYASYRFARSCNKFVKNLSEEGKKEKEKKKGWVGREQVIVLMFNA